jgi:hypothetical protein
MDSGLLACDAASPGKWFPTFKRNVMPSKRRDVPIQEHSFGMLNWTGAKT